MLVNYKRVGIFIAERMTSRASLMGVIPGINFKVRVRCLPRKVKQRVTTCSPPIGQSLYRYTLAVLNDTPLLYLLRSYRISRIWAVYLCVVMSVFSISIGLAEQSTCFGRTCFYSIWNGGWRGWRNTESSLSVSGELDELYKASFVIFRAWKNSWVNQLFGTQKNSMLCIEDIRSAVDSPCASIWLHTTQLTLGAYRNSPRSNAQYMRYVVEENTLRWIGAVSSFELN